MLHAENQHSSIPGYTEVSLYRLQKQKCRRHKTKQHECMHLWIHWCIWKGSGLLISEWGSICPLTIDIVYNCACALTFQRGRGCNWRFSRGAGLRLLQTLLLLQPQFSSSCLASASWMVSSWKKAGLMELQRTLVVSLFPKMLVPMIFVSCRTRG